jgi:hypothetical protein
LEKFSTDLSCVLKKEGAETFFWDIAKYWKEKQKENQPNC